MCVFSGAWGKGMILGRAGCPTAPPSAIVAPMMKAPSFDAFVEQAWDDHVAACAAVAERLETEAADWLTEAARLAPLVRLVHHVHGEHLGRWAEGRELISRLAALPACAADAEAAAAAQRAVASLDLSAGRTDAIAGLDAADRIRVAAMAAGNLAERDTARATLLFDQALAEAAAGAWPAGDPVHRALAISGNNLAASLEAKVGRSADERALMITAATAARTHWALAGGWLEVERAEYRLAMTWLQAGDPARALGHARAVLAIVDANDGPALERYFAFEAISKAAHAAGELGVCREAVAHAASAFSRMEPADQTAFAASLQALNP